MSTSSRIVVKFSVCGWSEDAWDPALGYLQMDSVKATDKRFEVEVSSTAVMYMSSVSSGTFVSIVVVAPADNSPQTLRVETFVFEQHSNDEFVMEGTHFDCQ